MAAPPPKRDETRARKLRVVEVVDARTGGAPRSSDATEEEEHDASRTAAAKAVREEAAYAREFKRLDAEEYRHRDDEVLYAEAEVMYAGRAYVALMQSWENMAQSDPAFNAMKVLCTSAELRCSSAMQAASFAREEALYYRKLPVIRAGALIEYKPGARSPHAPWRQGIVRVVNTADCKLMLMDDTELVRTNLVRVCGVSHLVSTLDMFEMQSSAIPAVDAESVEWQDACAEALASAAFGAPEVAVKRARVV